MSTNDKPGSSFGSAAYGGDNWSPHLTNPTDELSKAASNIGCLTGVLAREQQKTTAHS